MTRRRVLRQDAAAGRRGGTQPEPLPPPLGPLVEAFLDYLRAERGVADNTVAAVGGDLAHFARWAAAGGLANPQRPRRPELRDYLAHLHAGGLAPASAARQVSALRSFYRFCALEEEADSGPVELLEAPRLPERLPGTLRLEDVEKLLAAPCAKDRYGIRDRALLEAYYALGARASEVCDLKLCDLDLDGGCCRLQGKGSKERLALLGRPAVAALRAYLAQQRPARTPTSPRVLSGVRQRSFWVSQRLRQGTAVHLQRPWPRARAADFPRRGHNAFLDSGRRYAFPAFLWQPGRVWRPDRP